MISAPTDDGHRGRVFARRVFLGAAIYGFITLPPQYFLEHRIGLTDPPPITHPEHFYGFVGLALVWQFAFLLISRDVVRFRPLMPVAMLEKAAFSVPTFILFALGRVSAPTVMVASVDVMLGVLFFLAYRATKPGESR